MHAELDGAGLDLQAAGQLPLAELAGRFGEGVQRFVRFAARHPELNRIMVHEGCLPTERLRWLIDQHIRPLHAVTAVAWSRLCNAGIAAPVPVEVVHHVLVGAASLPYVVSAEIQLLGFPALTEPPSVEAHADGLIAALLPGRP